MSNDGAHKEILEAIKSAADSARSHGLHDLDEKLRMVLRTEAPGLKSVSVCTVSLLRPSGDL